MCVLNAEIMGDGPDLLLMLVYELVFRAQGMKSLLVDRSNGYRQNIYTFDGFHNARLGADSFEAEMHTRLIRNQVPY